MSKTRNNSTTFKNILTTAFQTMQKERMCRVPFYIEETNRKNPFGGWFNVDKKLYFAEEQNTAKEQELITTGKNYEANFLLTKYEKGTYKVAIAYVTRFRQYILLHGEHQYITDSTINEDLEYLTKEFLAQKIPAKELERQITAGLNQVRELQKSRYQNEIGNNQEYEIKKQILEERNAPFDEPLFEAIREQISLAKR